MFHIFYYYRLADDTAVIFIKQRQHVRDGDDSPIELTTQFTTMKYNFTGKSCFIDWVFRPISLYNNVSLQCFICILNSILFVFKLFILYVCVTQRFEFFKEKRYIHIYYYCVEVDKDFNDVTSNGDYANFVNAFFSTC